MKFGVRLAVQGEMGAAGQGWDYTRQMTLEAEEAGFDSVWLPDHVINAHMNKYVPMLENWTVLSALGALTNRVVFAGHTHNNALRNPALMAKMAATFDVMFGGRLIFALGSAWFKEEAEQYGFPFECHDERVSRLREALLITRSMWTEKETTFEGRFYRVKGAICEPKPLQKPYPPLWIPGDSEATRELVAEMGDVWLFYSKPPEVVADWSADMKRRCGGRAMPMATSAVLIAGHTEERAWKWAESYAAERAHRFPKPPTPQDVLDENLWGSPQRCIETIRAWQASGVEHLVIQPIPPLDGMRYFAQEIMPAFR